MNFIFSIPLRQRWKFRIKDGGKLSEIDTGNEAVLRLESSGHLQNRTVNLDEKTCFIAGDFIIPEESRHDADGYLKWFFEGFSTERLRETKGNFYLIIISEQEQLIRIIPGMMSLLPVYYSVSEDTLTVSSRADSIVKLKRGTFSVSKRYILEHFLFGYGFLNNTLFREIKLLPVNSIIETQYGKWRTLTHTRVSELFDNSPVPWRKSVEHITDLFIDRSKDYFPDQGYFSSLTGGLDGRTILAAGLARGKQITAYSYGSVSDKDIYIPQEICRDINLPYRAFILDQNYAEQSFLGDAREANRITEGNLRFSRATYLLLAREISGETAFMLSGNFGSELFRTPRMAGNMISSLVFAMFETDSDLEFANLIMQSPILKYLDIGLFKDELEELTYDCLTYRNNLRKTTSRIQGFYVYMFEEVFRKYFGPELILENAYITNRTPFIDFKFISEVLKSELAGCNSDFMTNNPFNRYKGQVVYPYIIKKTYPRLLTYKLDRGYSPGDFLSLAGKARIARGFLMRKLFAGRNRYKQPGYNKLAMSTNINRIDSSAYDFGFINRGDFDQLFKNEGWLNDYIGFNIMVSLFDYLKTVTLGNTNVRLQ